MSRTLTYARADARRLLRSRRVWAAAALLALMFLPSMPAVADPERRPIGELLLVIPFDLLTFALVVVAAVGYGAVAGQRGTVQFRLGLGGTRRELVAGTALARATATALVLVGALAAAQVVVVQNYGSPYAVAYWTMGAWLVLYGVVWTAVAVGYAAAFRSPYQSLAALAGTYVVFSSNYGVWGAVIRPLFALLATGSTSVPAYEVLANAPLWLRVVERLNPIRDLWLALRWSVGVAGPGTAVGNPFAHALGAVVLVLFGAVPLLVGIRRFERADLGNETRGFRLPLAARFREAAGRFVPSAARAGREPTETASSRSHRWLIARADLRHALRNRIVLAGVGLALLLGGPSVWQQTASSTVFEVSEQLVRVPGRLVLPLVALGVAVGHRAVVGKHLAGTAQFVLSTNGTRQDLFAGTVIARLTVVLGTALALLAVAWVLATVRLGALYPGAIAAGTLWIVAYAILWTSLTVSASAVAATRYRSLAAIFGAFLLFSTGVGLWGSVVRPLVAYPITGRFESGLVPNQDWPAWFHAVDHLNPFVSLETLKGGLYAAAGHGTQTAPSLPLVGYSAVVVVLFVLGALTVGLRRFESRPLG